MKVTVAAPVFVEIQTELDSERIEFGSIAHAVAWASRHGWVNNPISYILNNVDKPGSKAVIMRLLDFNGTGFYKARYGSLSAAQLMKHFTENS